MKKCEYIELSVIKEKNENESSDIKETKLPFFRQLLVCSGLWTTYFNTGLCLGAPTVAIPQLNATGEVSVEMASWLSCAFSYSAIPWVVILPLAARVFGRKPPLLFASAMSVASFILLYLGQTVWTFILSQIIQGVLFASNLTVSIILITECTSPKYRGIFLTIKSASVFWGVWVSNAIGTFFHWNQIGAFGLICCVYYLTFFLWPESPSFLATKGKFKECVQAHRWLKGKNEKAEQELTNLVKTQKKWMQHKQSLKDERQLADLMKIFTVKEFYTPLLLSALIMAQYHSLGKIVCGMYSIELIKKITDSESTAYIGMLILDGVSVFGMYVGCALSRFMKRRTLFFSSSVAGIFFLFLISFYLWLVYFNVIGEDKTVSIALLAAFSVTTSCGPMILSMSIYAELLPLRFKNTGVIICILIHFIFLGTGIKIAPWVFSTLKLYGTFSFYGTLATIFTFILFKYLPETKDKTLQEIEDNFKETIECKPKPTHVTM